MEDSTGRDTNESNRPNRHSLQKAGAPNPLRKKLSVELPALPEGRLFEPEPSQSEDVGNENSNAATRRFARFKRLSLPWWLRKGAGWIYRKIGVVATYSVFFLLIYTLLWILTGNNALPSRCYAYTRVPNANLTATSTERAAVCYGGSTLAVVVYYAIAFAFGQLVELIRIPGLLGMLLSGLMLRCLSVFTTSYTIFMDVPPPDDQYLPVVDTYLNGTTSSVVVEDVAVIFAATLRVNKELSATLRQVALATILTRAGLGLEPAVLRRIWSSMIRLTCLPCLTEALAGTIVAKFLMNWPWPWAAMMGFILAAVSPAVVVPNMLRLEIAGWGVAQGIPTLVMAASSLDDVLAITGFGIAQAIAFAKGDIAMVAVSGPLEVLAGALLGVCLALILWVLPPPAMEHSSTVRGMLLYAISIAAITGTIKMGLPGAGALCCLICSLMCSVGWRNGMPWRFKHTSQPLDEMDTNKSNALATNGSQLSTDAIAPTAATEHHEYYHQHLRSLRRRLNKSGGIAKKNALAAVSRSRRFSLPEPKPLYEENDFNTILSDVDQSNAYLRRSLSAFRPISAKKKGLVRWNTTTENTANIHTSTTPSEDPDSDFLTTDINSSAAPPLRVTPEALLALDKAKGQECLKVMRSYMATCWWFVQPLLFCLIGADIPVEKLRPDTIGLGIASILVALTFRIFASVLAVTPSPLKLKEKIFVAVAWIPKATVQAAIGPLALDSARATGDPVLINWGEQIITLSALSILLTAPTAAILIPLVAPCLLQQDPVFIPVANSTTNESNTNCDVKVDSSVSNSDDDLEASQHDD